MKKILISLIALCSLMVSCNHKNSNETPTHSGIDYSQVAIPEFCADSALLYTSQQLSFGFRCPGQKGHDLCATYLANIMRRFADTVIVQPFNTTLWNGQSVSGKNIIASLDPQMNNRVLLAAHWDSRMWADQDPNEANHKLPIMGANDGASSVAALIEMARVMSAQRPDVGIDFIFFDLEDQGLPAWENRYEDNTWCKGSQYWASTPHRPYYRANYGVLFDMVGVTNPRFTKEEISRQFAPGIVNKLWDAAAAIGYGNVFVSQNTDAILDDHLYINQIIGIPTVDVVQNSPNCSFYPYWHTLKDDIEAVDAQSLKIAANATMKLIYGDYPSK